MLRVLVIVFIQIVIINSARSGLALTLKLGLDRKSKKGVSDLGGCLLIWPKPSEVAIMVSSSTDRTLGTYLD